MRTQDAVIARYRDSLPQRLAASASRVLGCAVVFVRWERDRWGADIPVFSVPTEYYQRAVNAGVRIDNSRVA